MLVSWWDRVVKGFSNVQLEKEEGDGEKTLGEVEKTFICWRKRYIIIPGASPSSLLTVLKYQI